MSHKYIPISKIMQKPATELEAHNATWWLDELGRLRFPYLDGVTELHLATKAMGEGDHSSTEKTSLDSSRVNERILLRKIDLRVVPVLCVLYVLAFLDRVNIGNAALFGLKEDLKLGGSEYNNALVIFFIPYAICDIPANALMKRFKPHVWLSVCMFLFGLITICQGLTQSYGGLLTTRFLLGIFESAMFPGCIYLLAMWYRRLEAQKRCSFFFGSNNIAGAFGGLLASAIGKMDGIRGYRGWRWVFILEGVLTCVISFVLFFTISDFPEEASWLTPTEKEFVKARLREDVGYSQHEKKLTLRLVWDTVKDVKVILGGFMYFGLIISAYGYAYFAPTIIKEFGHSNIQSQLLSVPQWVSSLVVLLLVAWLSDRLQHRFLFTILPILVAVIGFIVLISTDHPTKVKYGALFLSTAGTFSAMPVVLCWFSTNIAGHRRRSIAIAWQVGFGNIGGIVAAYAFLAEDAPRYFKGYGLCIAFMCFSGLSSCAYLIACIRENHRRDKLEDSSEKGGNEFLDEQCSRLGDLSLRYRYML
ncbi:MFS general substrate transporter [Cristinia sonorae]|uniref:MFS general substrate transporter n=1 Tax=Cristinia sonorae TaxID=1940300 RepID=A0A8K0UDM9_9AGAR|nr:MFS general substrate transporter [Cristinia sonorae]